MGDSCPICDACSVNEARLIRELQAREHASFEARQKRGSTVLMDFEGIFADRYKKSSVSLLESMTEEKAFSILAPAVSGAKASSSSLADLITSSAGRLHLSLTTVEQKLETDIVSCASENYNSKQFENFLLLCGFHWIPREEVPKLFDLVDTNHSGNLHVSEILLTSKKAHELCRKILTRRVTDFKSLAQSLVACNSGTTECFLTNQLARSLYFFPLRVIAFKNSLVVSYGRDCGITTSFVPKIILSLIDVDSSESERPHPISNIFHYGPSNGPP